MKVHYDNMKIKTSMMFFLSFRKSSVVIGFRLIKTICKCDIKKVARDIFKQMFKKNVFETNVRDVMLINVGFLNNPMYI